MKIVAENRKAKFNTKITSNMKHNGEIVDVIGVIKGRDEEHDSYIVKFNDNKNNIVNKLFDERPRAWKYGPVFISIYEQMKFCDKSLVCKAYLKANDVNTKFDDKAEMILSLVYEFYGKYSGNRLSDMTRYEYPYKNTKLGDEIKDIDIYEWYRRTE